MSDIMTAKRGHGKVKAVPRLKAKTLLIPMFYKKKKRKKRALHQWFHAWNTAGADVIVYNRYVFQLMLRGLAYTFFYPWSNNRRKLLLLTSAKKKNEKKNAKQSWFEKTSSRQSGTVTWKEAWSDSGGWHKEPESHELRDSAGRKSKVEGWGSVVYPLFMTKVWPDFTKAQPRGRLKRAASVTRVTWGRLVEKLQGREGGTGIALRRERQITARPLMHGYSLMSFRFVPSVSTR